MFTISAVTVNAYDHNTKNKKKKRVAKFVMNYTTSNQNFLVHNIITVIILTLLKIPVVLNVTMISRFSENYFRNNRLQPTDSNFKLLLIISYLFR